MDPHLHEGPRIAEEVDPLPGGELAALVLNGDLLLAATELRLITTLVKILGQTLHPGVFAALDLVGSFRRLA
jgi:hypothetical protein